MKWVMLTKVKKLLPDEANLQQRYAIADRILQIVKGEVS